MAAASWSPLHGPGHVHGDGSSNPSTVRTSVSVLDTERVRADNVEGMRAIEYSVTGAPGPDARRAPGARARPRRGPGPHPPLRGQPDRLEGPSGRGRRPGRPGAQVPNQDGAGVVDAVGEGVEPALVGDRVWIWRRPTGALARHGGGVHRRAGPPGRPLLPGAPSFDLGATLGVPFLTAHRCLTVGEDGPTGSVPAPSAGAPCSCRRRRRRRQRGHPARPLVRRDRHHHGQQPGEGAARRRGRRRPRRRLPRQDVVAEVREDRPARRRHDRRGRTAQPTPPSTPRCSARTAPSRLRRRPATTAPRVPVRPR